MPHKLELRETAGVHQLYVLDDLTPIDMLDAHYNGTHQRAAA